MSASFLEKINIFYLLGIETLPHQEEKKFTDDMTQIIIQNGITSALEKEKIPENVISKLNEILAEDPNSPKSTDAIKLQRYIMDNVPNIREHLYNASMEFKKKVFIDQLQTIETQLNTIEVEEDREYFRLIINNLRNNIKDEEEEAFFNNHKLYTDLKIKYRFD